MSKKLEVLQVNKFYYPIRGGIEHVVQEIAEGLNSRTKMKVLVCQKKGNTSDEKINDVDIHRSASLGVAFSCPVSLSFFSDFKRLAKDADIIHIHMPFPPADLATMLTINYKGKIVLWWHCDIVQQKKLLVFYKPIMMWLLKRADKIIVTSSGLRDSSRFLAPYRDKCVIIPYGVDPYYMQESKTSDLNIPKNNSLKEILFVGRLVYYKGCGVLLRAFAQTKGAVLNIAGDGTLFNELKELTYKLGIDKKVRFLGSVTNKQLVEAYKQCDFLVLSSTSIAEAFGLVQAEAMCFGKPVINTDLPTGVPTVSIDGLTGITVPANNVSALATAMQTLIDDDKLRMKYAEAAYSYAHKNYTIEKMLDKVFRVYTELL